MVLYIDHDTIYELANPLLRGSDFTNRRVDSGLRRYVSSFESSVETFRGFGCILYTPNSKGENAKGTTTNIVYS